MKKTLLAAIALTGLVGFTSAQAQLKTSNGQYDANDYSSTVAQGDLILGIQKTLGTGNSLMVDLGSFANLSSLGTLNLSSDLTAAGFSNFGSTLQFGVFGIASGTVYATTSLYNAYANLSTAGQNTLNYSGLVGPSQVFSGMEDAGQTTPSGVFIGNSDTQSWAYQQVIGFGAGIYGNSALNVAIGSDAYLSAATANIAGTGFGSIVGKFNIDNSGVLTYTAVPEPSTYALMGFGALLLVIAYRRKSA
jgi:hypothetical protein